LEVATYSGIFGFIAWLYLLKTIFREGLYVLKNSRDKFRYFTVLGMISGIIGMLTYFLFGGKFTEGTFLGVGLMFWGIVGIIIKTKKLEEAQGKNLQ
jgi:O-antigen ligase